MLRRHRTARALALSLLLHLVLGVWIASRPPPAPRTVPEAPPAQSVITFEVREVAPKPNRPEVAPAEPEPATPLARKEPQRRVAQAEPESPAPRARKEPRRKVAKVAPEVEAQPPTGSADPQGESMASAPAPAVPRLKSLVPQDTDFLHLGVPVPARTTRGITVVNDGSGPSPEAVAQREAAEAKTLVDGWVADDKATLKVANGLVDDYFRELKHALEDGASKPPRDSMPEGSFGHRLFTSYLDQLGRYGASGSPTGTALTNPDGVPRTAGTSPMERELARDANAQTAAGLAQMAHLRSIADGVGDRLLAIVEIRQAPDGAFAEARLLTPSGNDLFDAFVLATAPNSVSLLPAPERLSRQFPSGIRSVWSFEGLVEYRKKASEMKTETLEDKAFLVAGGLVSLLTGAPFEETTGDVYLMDLRDPKFRCRVKLLKLY